MWHSLTNQLFLCGLSSFRIFFSSFLVYSSFCYFYPYFIYIFHLFYLSILYTAVTSFMNYSFTCFLFILPISHFSISLFLVFSVLLIFNLILVLTKKWSYSISMPLILLTSQIFVQHVFYKPVCDLSGYLYCCQSDDIVNVLMLIPCSCYC